MTRKAYRMSDPRYVMTPYSFPGFQRPPALGPFGEPIGYQVTSSMHPTWNGMQHGRAVWQQRIVPGGYGPKKKHAKKKKQRQGQDQPSRPSLFSLRKENRVRIRKHLASGQGGTPWPLTAPEAPRHSQTFIFPSPAPDSSLAAPASPALGLHYSTPVASFASSEKGYWRNGYGSGIGQQGMALCSAAEAGAAAGIDMFGTNVGLVEDYDTVGEHATDESTSDEELDPYGLFGLDDEHISAQETVGLAAGGTSDSTGLQKRIDEQAVYICQLEETNLRLQEKLWMVEHRSASGLEQLHGGGRLAMEAGDASDDRGSQHSQQQRSRSDGAHHLQHRNSGSDGAELEQPLSGGCSSEGSERADGPPNSSSSGGNLELNA